MFGRDEERERIEHVLDRVLDGPMGIALEGAPGIGKTTLWREGVASARGRGYRVLTSAPGEPDTALAFAGLGDLFDGVVDEVGGGLPGPQRAALAAALSLEGASDAPIDQLALPRGILIVLRRLAADGPLVVGIDDEQWLDRASARVLAFALCRLRDESVCVLLTRRPNSDGALWPALAKGFGGGGLQALSVAALDLETIDSLLREHLGRTIPRPLVRRVYAACGGNPLYALAIARGLDATQAGAGEVPIPRTLADAMASRLRRVDERAHDPLLAVAALSSPTVAVLQAVLPSFALSDLDSALREEVIEIAGDRVRFTHPLLASTHYASASASRRRELHRLLAEVLGDEEERARQLALGAEGPDREIALVLEQAAGAAVRRGAPDAGALLLEDAARLTPIDAGEARGSRTIAAAQQHWASGNAARARELLEVLIDDLPSGPTRARALAELAPIRTEDWTAGEALLRQALTEVGDHVRLRAQVEWELSGLMTPLGKFDLMLAYADSAIASAERAGDPGLLALTLANRAVAACFAGRRLEREALDRAIELEHLAPVTTSLLPSGSLAQILFWSDDYEHARPALERCVARARELGEEYDAAALLYELAMLEWHAGNRELAERHRVAVHEAVQDRGEHSLDLWMAWGESLFAAGRGELEEARMLARQAIEMAERHTNLLIGALPTIVLAWVELWTGRPHAAHDLLHPLRESFVSNGCGFVGSLMLGMWSCDIEALIACGRLDQAQPVIDDLRSRADTVENPHTIAVAERCRALLLAARGEVPAAIDALEAVLVEHAKRPLGPEIARTLLELGTLRRRAKRKRAAKQTLERSLEMFESIGAPMWQARARDELGRIGLRRAVVSEGLTPAQTRVAELVAEGMSNREIASTLYMSERSVEAHLTKVYREYGVRSRSQLVAALSERAATGSESRAGQ
ncbi:MAG: helix-turn-helix transcriptional regulator [Solirubrobacteraceae bacterium]